PPPPAGFDFEQPPAKSQAVLPATGTTGPLGAIPPPPPGFDLTAPPPKSQAVLPKTGATGPVGRQPAKDFSVIPPTGATGPVGSAFTPEDMQKANAKNPIQILTPEQYAANNPPSKGPVFAHLEQTPKSLLREPTNAELPGLVGQQITGKIHQEAPFLVGPFST